MKKVPVLFALLFVSISYAQISVINTGTSDNLISISRIQNNVLVGGHKGYLAKAYGECNSLIPLNNPVFSLGNYLCDVFRPDTNTLYLTANSSNYNYTIWKSNNGGYNWTKKFDTTGLNLQPIFLKCFDSLNSVSIANSNKLVSTTNGFNTWAVVASNDNLPSCATIYGDSTLIVGSLTGGVSISKNRGQSWQGVYGTGNSSPVDFKFLNKDTIFGITDVGYLSSCFLKSLNGNWSCIPFTGQGGLTDPPEGFSKLCVKSRNEIYILARNGLTSMGYLGYGVILKTTDLGQSWSTFTTPFKENLNDIQFINDSIALVCGNNGLLFKWNTKMSVFTDVKENKLNELQVNFFPNPVTEKLNVQCNGNTNLIQVKITNVLSQTVSETIFTGNEAEISFRFLPRGLYFVKLESEKGQKVIKILKE